MMFREIESDGKDTLWIHMRKTAQSHENADDNFPNEGLRVSKHENMNVSF